MGCIVPHASGVCKLSDLIPAYKTLQKVYLHMLRMREISIARRIAAVWTSGKLQREGRNFKLGHKDSGYQRAKYKPWQTMNGFVKLSLGRLNPCGFLLRPYPSHSTKWLQVSDCLLHTGCNRGVAFREGFFPLGIYDCLLCDRDAGEFIFMHGYSFGSFYRYYQFSRTSVCSSVGWCVGWSLARNLSTRPRRSISPAFTIPTSLAFAVPLFFHRTQLA